MVINLVKKNVAEKQRGGEALAISVPSHDFSHDFWSVLLQVFFLADTLTLPSRFDRSSPTTTLLLSTFRIMCPATPILSSAVLSALIWSTTNNQQSLAMHMLRYLHASSFRGPAEPPILESSARG